MSEPEVPAWTTMPPRTPGWYWRRGGPNSPPAVVQIYMQGNRLAWRCDPSHCGVELHRSKRVQWWPVPLEVPQ